jgi:hypothetical protein
MDYTIFHIGLYATLCTLLAAILGLERWKEQIEDMSPYLITTLVCFVIAGAFGGLIGSNLPSYATWETFQNARLGPWFFPNMMPAPWVASAEHTAFWVGIVIALIGVIRNRPRAAAARSRPSG